MVNRTSLLTITFHRIAPFHFAVDEQESEVSTLFHIFLPQVTTSRYITSKCNKTTPGNSLLINYIYWSEQITDLHLKKGSSKIAPVSLTSYFSFSISYLSVAGDVFLLHARQSFVQTSGKVCSLIVHRKNGGLMKSFLATVSSSLVQFKIGWKQMLFSKRKFHTDEYLLIKSGKYCVNMNILRTKVCFTKRK